ncbi:MAG TPA: outer membrane beta-barrel protein, partial [Gemmatimonadales bacterium]|nr:outer membrane beta-barrel protein [Gemmatimonadales bacterium]
MFLLLGAGAPAAAQQRAYRVELSGAAGYHIFDSRTDLASAIGGALRLGLWVSGPLSLEAEGSYTYPHTDTPLRQRVGVTTLSGWALANLPVGDASFIILKAGYGHTSYGSCPAVSVPGSGPCGAAGSLQAGAGVRISLSPTLFMRYEAIVNRSLTTL